MLTAIINMMNSDPTCSSLPLSDEAFQALKKNSHKPLYKKVIRNNDYKEPKYKELKTEPR